MAGAKRPIIYWDACVFISWLGDETLPQRTQSELDGVEEHIRLFDKERIILATSVLSITEVLTLDVSEEKKELFRQYTSRPNFYYVEVNKEIAEISNEIREYYKQQEAVDGIPTIDTPDAIHVASAIYINLYAGGCHGLFTYDGCRGKKTNKKRRSMIGIGGMVAGKYTLPILAPEPSSGPNLFTTMLSASDSEYEDSDEDSDWGEEDELNP
jgi:hypothetical protein